MTRSPVLAPVPLAQLRDWAATGYGRREFSVFGGRPWLLFRAAGCRLSGREREDIAAWLHALPCPTLALAANQDDEITRAADVILQRPVEATPLIAVIEHSPIAAAVLVELLRASAGLPLAAALSMESLAYATLQGGPEFRRWLAAQRPGVAGLAGAADAGPAVCVAREGAVLRVELNRPSRRNAISVEMRDGLVEAFELAASDAQIERVVLSGRGKCFSIGGDLDEFGSVPDPASGHLIRALSLPARALIACAGRSEVRLHGACIGAGIELPAFAHRVLAAEDSFFQLPELRFGLIPGAGGCISLPRRIGRQRTAWMVLSGRRLPLRTARAWGLVDG